MAKKKNPGGRPKKITAAVLQKLEYGFMKGLSDRQCCKFADISPATLYNYCNKHPEFLERKEMLKENPTIQAKLNIVESIESGNVDDSKWYLERKCKEEFSLRQEVGLSGNVNNPLEGLTTEEIRQMIADD